MTEEERGRLVQAKAEAAQRLAAEDIARYRLRKCDKRIDSYVREVAGHPERHNLWELLAVRRFLRMVEKYGLALAHVHRFFTLYEGLYFPGKEGQRRYELTPVQAFQFASIFGFWKDGRRVVREACLYVPRKFSKTTSTAALAVFDLLFGDSNAECYTGANSQDQAKKCFDVIRGAMLRLDPTGRLFRVNEETIKTRMPGRTSLAQCLTAAARTKDGLNASTVIMDEFSQARDNSLLTVLTTSMGVRDNPLTVIITTASDVFDGPFYYMLQGYKRLLLGEGEEDDSVFAHLFEPDVGDPEDSEATWLKVHPHIGVTVSLDFYRREWQAAQRNGAEAMLAFRTKLLNVYSENDKKCWISAAEARKHMKRIDPRKFAGMPRATVAVDLSVRDDFSAVSVAVYDGKTHRMKFHTKYFFPKGALPGHANERLYRAWAEAGHLELMDGDVIDYSRIVDYILELNETCLIMGIGFDPYRSKQMQNELEAHPDAAGVHSILKAIGQTPSYFAAPVETFEHGLYTGMIEMDDNPITAYCFGNAVMMADRLDNRKPEKMADNMKIDGLITMLMCVRLWLDMTDQAS